MMKKRSVKRGLLVLAGGLLLTGCVYEDESAPGIAVRQAVVTRIPQPSALQRVPEKQPATERASPGVPGSWMPSAQRDRDWTAIIIHHSATPTSNAVIFDRRHREDNGWDGVGYDFVIGNGSDSADGEIEVIFRWWQQVAGAHCGGTPDNWANEAAIGICLVGDFGSGRPTPAQMRSLARLVQFLQQRYRIPGNRIYRYGTTPGARPTECPRARFPMAELMTTLEM